MDCNPPTPTAMLDPLEGERRTLARYHFLLDARCHTIAGAKDMAPARICDISARGLGLLMGQRYEPGSLLSLELPDTPQSIPSTLLVRVANVRERKGVGWIHGCAFASHLNGNDMQAAFRVVLSKPPSFERRTLLRYQLAIGATGRSISSAMKYAWEGNTLDISAGGIALVINKRIDSGTLLTIKLQSPAEGDSRALMARVLHARTRGNGGWMHGCSFPSKLREDELKAILKIGWAQARTRPTPTSAAAPQSRLETLKLALADHIESNSLDQARGIIAAVLEISPTDPDALATLSFIESFLDPPAPIGEVRRFKGHRSSVNCVAFSTSGLHVMSGSGLDDDLQKDEDRSIRFWDVDKGYEIFCYHGHKSPITSVAFARRGSRALSAGRCGTISLWDVERRCILRQFDKHGLGVNSVAFSTLGRWALSGGDDMRVRLWDADYGRCMRRFAGHTGAVSSVVFFPDERTAASGSVDGSIRLWNLEAQHKQICIEYGKPVLSLAVSADGRHLLSGGADNTIRLWDVASRAELRRFIGHLNVVNSVAFSPDGRWVLSGSADNTVRLWDLQTGREILCLTGHEQSVKCVAFAPDGQHAISASADQTMRLWRLPRPAHG